MTQLVRNGENTIYLHILNLLAMKSPLTQ